LAIVMLLISPCHVPDIDDNEDWFNGSGMWGEECWEDNESLQPRRKLLHPATLSVTNSASVL
jgi:hypothetical protein